MYVYTIFSLQKAPEHQVLQADTKNYFNSIYFCITCYAIAVCTEPRVYHGFVLCHECLVHIFQLMLYTNSGGNFCSYYSFK